VENLIRGDAQDGVSKLAKILLSFGIVLALLLVDLAIDLHDEARRDAEEIDHVRPDGALATELLAAYVMSAERSPQNRLGRR
jgi:hypothetical protein